MRWMWTLVSVGIVASACNGSGKGDDDDDDSDDVSVEDLCNAAADCAEGAGQEYDVDECISASNDAGANAQQAGCASEFRSLVACAAAHSECLNGVYTPDNECDGEVEVYGDCAYGGPYTVTAYPTYGDDDDDTTYGDDDDDDTTYGDDDDDDTTRGFVGTELAINCDTPTQVNFFIASDVDDGLRAVVDAADTANQYHYYEAHTLYPTYSETNYTEFDLTIPTNGRYFEGEESLFSCAPDVHFAENIFGSYMSYIARVYDIGGLYECFAGGNDASGMLAKDYETYGNTVDHADISSATCSTARSAR